MDGSRQFALRSRRVVLPHGTCEAVVVVVDDRITAVHTEDLGAVAAAEDLGELVISPGGIDAHVHINEPGRSHWEGFETATRAAAAGGITTLVDMPLNSSPVTTSSVALAEKRDVAQGKCWVDVGFYGGLVPGNAECMKQLAEDGVLGVKAFLCPSGLDEFPNCLHADLHAAIPVLVDCDLPLLVHAELTSSPAVEPTDPRSYRQYAQSRPVQWELDAIEQMIRLCREYGIHVHIVHLACTEALPILAAAKREGLPISVETCPHYLFFDPQLIADGDTRFKCAPPIRPNTGAALWRALVERTIDTIGSDHSPCPPELKRLSTGDFTRAWGGISSLQLTLSTMWKLCSTYGLSCLTPMSEWFAAMPAKLTGLDGRKGRLAPGLDADLVVWDPDIDWRVEETSLHHRHKLTPYEGAELKGEVRRSYLRGRLVYRDGVFLGPPSGQLLKRPAVP